MLPCPQSATAVHRLMFSAFATATGTSNFLRLTNNPSFPDQFSFATCQVLRLLLESSHRQLCRCEKIAGEYTSLPALKLQSRAYLRLG